MTPPNITSSPSLPALVAVPISAAAVADGWGQGGWGQTSWGGGGTSGSAGQFGKPNPTLAVLT